MIITLPSLCTENDPLWESFLTEIAKNPTHCLIVGNPQETQKLVEALVAHPSLSPIRTHFFREIANFPLDVQQTLVSDRENKRLVATSQYSLSTLKEILDSSLYNLLTMLVIQIAPNGELKNPSFTQTVLINYANLSEDKVILKDLLQEIEDSYIDEALIKSKGVISLAANLLGLRRTTLIEKIKKRKIKKIAT